MYVYLKFGDGRNDVRVISNVTIDEDCNPVVNGQMIHNSGSREESMTPNSPGCIDAVCWFKALPIQAVYIDCSARDARWCTKSVTIQDKAATSVKLRRTRTSFHASTSELETPEKAETETECPPFMPESARPLFSEQPGMSSFNPVIDELFERVEKLCFKWDALTESRQVNREVARILHSCVFPAVTFQKEDTPVLQECLRLIIVKHENIDKEIVAKKSQIDITDKYLARLKEVILSHEDMTSQSYLQACRADFVDVLYLQVTKDIQEKNMNLDILQTKINDMKKSGKDADKMDQMKSERDDLFSSMQNLLTVREAIRNHLYRPFVPKKRSKKLKKKIDEKDASLHTNFQMAYQQLVQDKDLLKQLCYRKLHLSSVREAIESTLKSVQREHPTSCGDFTEFSINSVSQGGDGGKKTWKSMQARVDEWMESGGSLNYHHMRGCRLINDLVEGILSDSEVSHMGRTSPTADTTDMDGSSGKSSTGAYNWDVSSERAPMLQMIGEQAQAHLWDMAEKVVLRMNLDASPESRHLNRAWMCYDRHFWKEAGEAIERAYTHFHAAQALEIHRQASSAALADIMDSRFFHKVFMDGMAVATPAGKPGPPAERASGNSAAVGRLQTQDTLSALSLDLQRCSVSDLYALANSDGAKVNCHMLELDGFIAVEPLGVGVSGDASKGEHGGGETVAAGKSGKSGRVNVEGNNFGGSGIIISITDCEEAGHQSGSSSHEGSSFNSTDLNRTDDDDDDRVVVDQCGLAETSIRKSQTVASVLGVFDAIVDPYHEKVRQVLKAPTLMEKMRAVWKSVDFLSRKTQEVCNDQGMDSLLPMSIFATASFSEDLFVQYFIQLLILLDFRPSFALHSIYDFSLSNAISTFMFLFEGRFCRMATTEDLKKSEQSDDSD
ncbi:uncharacterized protein LOC143275787 [Babylonia areolata]|uniref:uncharacterized protein LOC143275787 n=1 Tax=Babylonia areolata TaxID=304850 RepID=UPI003FD17226